MIAQVPSHCVAISPFASRGLDPSQLVVVGSFSTSPCVTMSYSRVSPTRRSAPFAQGSPSASLVVAAVSQLTEPLTYVQDVSGHWAAKLV